MTEHSMVIDDDDGPSDISVVLNPPIAPEAPPIDLHRFAAFQEWERMQAVAKNLATGADAAAAGLRVASEPTPGPQPLGDGQLHPDNMTTGGHAAIRPIGVRKLVRIICEETDNMPPTGYPIGINGRCYIIRAGEEVDVPQEVIEVLDNAVESKAIVDPATRRVTGHRNRLRIPYRRVSRAAY